MDWRDSSYSWNYECPKRQTTRKSKDQSHSLLWTLFVPIDEITDENSEAVVDWLEFLD